MNLTISILHRHKERNGSQVIQIRHLNLQIFPIVNIKNIHKFHCKHHWNIRQKNQLKSRTRVARDVT